MRIPRKLHMELAQRAEKEGVSLNLLVNSVVSQVVAQPFKKQRPFYWMAYQLKLRHPKMRINYRGKPVERH